MRCRIGVRRKKGVTVFGRRGDQNENMVIDYDGGGCLRVPREVFWNL